MMNLAAIKVLAYLALACGIFYAGFETKGAFIAQRDLAIIEAKKEFIETYQKAESDKATILENTLSQLKANERTIIREIPKIITRDVYRNKCLDDDGLRAIESARAGKTDTSEPSH